jgi:hypothetical protein
VRSPILILILASFAIAEPTTKPRDIAPKHRPTVEYSGVIVDYARPAYIPEFATNKTVPALQEQREHALTFQPMPVVYGVWGWPVYGWYGWSPYTHGGFGWAPMP